MAENQLFEEVPECHDAEILEWRQQQGDYIRSIVGRNPCLRYIPYRKDMVGIDFFECDTLEGPSVEVNVHIDGTRQLSVQESDIVHVSMPDYASAILLASMLGYAVGQMASRVIFVP